MPMPNELIEKWTELNQENMEAIKRFSENYTKVMDNLTQPQIEIATTEEAIEKLSENYGIITDLTRRQMEMVDGYMGEVAKKTVGVAIADVVKKATKETVKPAGVAKVAKDIMKLLKNDAHIDANFQISAIKMKGVSGIRFIKPNQASFHVANAKPTDFIAYFRGCEPEPCSPSVALLERSDNNSALTSFMSAIKAE